MVTSSARPQPDARRRRLRRTDERGATMFVVLTVIAIISAIGTYAISNARYEVRTAGYVRQRSLSEMVTGVGAQASSSELGAAPAAYVGRMRATSSTGETCVNNGGLGAGGPASAYPPCYHLYLKDVENRTGLPYFTAAVPGSGSTAGVPGSLGLTELNGGFWVEMTDPIQVVRPVAGAPIDGSPGTPKFIDVTVTSNGVVWQDLVGGTVGVIDSNERSSATFTTGRGHVIVGPVYGPI